MNPKVWLVGSLLVYSICLSGVVYTVTQNAPFTHLDDNGDMMWYQTGRGQLGMEGLVMSVAITTAGILLVITVEGSRQIQSSIYK